MIGYQEIFIDFFYVQQIVILIYLYIGNIGIILEDVEVNCVWVVGLIICDLLLIVSNWCSKQLLFDYLKVNGIVVIVGIDICCLICIFCEKGLQNGCILVGVDVIEECVLELVCVFFGLKGMDLVKEVIIVECYEWCFSVWNLESDSYLEILVGELLYYVVVYDYGVKLNILCMLVVCGCCLIVVLVQILVSEVLVLNLDGIFFFNGFGDFELCDYVIQVICEFFDIEILVFGICFGYQLLVLVFGVKILKMGYGYYGVNYLVQDLDSGVVMIISQNYGFVVDESILLDNL